MSHSPNTWISFQATQDGLRVVSTRTIWIFSRGVSGLKISQFSLRVIWLKRAASLKFPSKLRTLIIWVVFPSGNWATIKRISLILR